MPISVEASLPFYKKIFFYFVLLFLCCSFVLLLGEIYIRFFSSHGYTTPGIRKGETLEFEAAVLSKLVLKQKAKTVPLWGGKQCRINSKGYRGDEFDAEKPKSTYRIIIYGGSSVFDMAADLDGHWLYLTEERLHQQGMEHVEIINAGMPGLTAMDSVGRLFGEGHLYNPDCVVLCNAWNDIKHFHKPEPWLRHYKPYIYYKDYRIDYMNVWDQSLCEFSQLYERLRSRYFHYRFNVGTEGAVPEYETENPEFQETALSQYRLAVETFVDMARNIKAEPILMTQARLVSPDNTPEEREKIYYEYQPFSHERLCEAFAKTDEIIGDVAERKVVKVIDASSKMTGIDAYFQDHVHTTHEGSLKLAEIVSEFFGKEMLK